MTCPVCGKPVIRDRVTIGNYQFHRECHEAGNRVTEVKEWDNDNEIRAKCGYCKKPYVREDEVLWHNIGGTFVVQHLKCWERVCEIASGGHPT